MRVVVDKNKKTGVQVTKLVTPKGVVQGYNLEDTTKNPGTEGFVIGNTQTLGEARQFAAIKRINKSEETLPKSAYPEQQTGYHKHTTRR